MTGYIVVVRPPSPTCRSTAAKEVKVHSVMSWNFFTCFENDMSIWFRSPFLENAATSFEHFAT
ncbi:hypothetical protein PanWU01x14_213460 [Parasponia andersonii]|uniref:Uncharacterized protein n=1 Tax=Parasponia andersonii TaxID=3476 RepID=A0A2P5BSL0_PARAD|nr:hypothetical protein PanWU01x14_213460 [Parasponia andersonii]